MTEDEHYAIVNELLAAPWITPEGAYCLAFATVIGRAEPSGIYPPREIVENFARCQSAREGIAIFGHFNASRKRR